MKPNNNFDLKKFLVENKLTENSKALSKITTLAESIMAVKGIVITSSSQLAKLLTTTVGHTDNFEVAIQSSTAEATDYLNKYAIKSRKGKMAVIKSPAHLADALTIWCRDNDFDRITYVPEENRNTLGYLKAVKTDGRYDEEIFMEVYPKEVTDFWAQRSKGNA
jgi:hypothetical protein